MEVPAEAEAAALLEAEMESEHASAATNLDDMMRKLRLLLDAGSTIAQQNEFICVSKDNLLAWKREVVRLKGLVAADQSQMLEFKRTIETLQNQLQRSAELERTHQLSDKTISRQLEASRNAVARMEEELQHLATIQMKEHQAWETQRLLDKKEMATQRQQDMEAYETQRQQDKAEMESKMHWMLHTHILREARLKAGSFVLFLRTALVWAFWGGEGIAAKVHTKSLRVLSHDHREEVAFGNLRAFLAAEGLEWDVLELADHKMASKRNRVAHPLLELDDLEELMEMFSDADMELANSLATLRNVADKLYTTRLIEEDMATVLANFDFRHGYPKVVPR